MRSLHQVYNHLEVAPLPRPQQPCDIPGPDLARARRHQLGFLVFGMTPLRSALSNWHLGGQNAIHRTFAAQVDVFVEQGRHNLGRGPVHESLRTQRVEDLVSFLLAQGTGWGSGGAADARSMAPDDDRTWLGRP